MLLSTAKYRDVAVPVGVPASTQETPETVVVQMSTVSTSDSTVARQINEGYSRAGFNDENLRAQRQDWVCPDLKSAKTDIPILRNGGEIKM